LLVRDGPILTRLVSFLPHRPDPVAERKEAMVILSAEEIATEAKVSRARVDWLTEIGILKPLEPGNYRYGDVFRLKLIEALLEAGFTTELIERAVVGEYVTLDHVDQYYPEAPDRRSVRTFAEFCREAGSRGSTLPAVYEVLGLPQPEPSSPLQVHEEELLQRFLDAWSIVDDEETLIRATRLMAEGTRVIALGWMELLDERAARPARQRLLRGEIDRFPTDVQEAFVELVKFAPKMMEWLTLRFLERRAFEGIVGGFEEFLASRNLGPPPRPTPPPAVVFVDISGYTRLTEERGDQVAVGFAATLQREAHTAAASNGGRLVKLLGDGAMLQLPDAGRGLKAAFTLMEALRAHGDLRAHAGVHAGPVIERDLDLFGRTVNLASRIAEVAEPGEVLASQAAVELVEDQTIRFEQADSRTLKGVAEPVALYRAHAA
jgi:adenylate cyclase